MTAPQAGPTALDRLRGQVRLWRMSSRRSWGMSVFLGCTLVLLVLLVFGVGEGDGASLPSRLVTLVFEILLILAGLSLSYALLPDEPVRFWRVRAQDMAATVPREDLFRGGMEVARALGIMAGPFAGEDRERDALERSGIDTDDRTMPTLAVSMYEASMEAVRQAVAEPHRIVIGMRYEVTVTPGPKRQKVHVRLQGRRLFRDKDRLFFAFCSDERALRREFESAAQVLSRELVPFLPDESREQWLERIRRSPVSLVVDDQPIQVVDTVETQVGDSVSVRVEFDVSQLPVSRRFSTCELHVQYHLAGDDRAFPVKFGSYYCFGAEIRFTVEGEGIDLHVYDYFRGVAFGAAPRYLDREADAEVTLRDEGVLFPGAGAVFDWQPGPILREPPAQLRDRQVPDGLLLPLPPAIGLPGAEASPTGHVAEVDWDSPVPVRASTAGEPLVDAEVWLADAEVLVKDTYGRRLLLDRRPQLLRQGVVDQLLVAQEVLRDHEVGGDLQLVLLDCWRTAEHQEALLKAYREQTRGRPGYVADVDGQPYRAPHLTGGAVDVSLALHGVPLRLGSHHDEFSTDAHLAAYEMFDEDAAMLGTRNLRRLLATAMLAAGFAPLRNEWWHWSYGDDVWARWWGQVVLPASTDPSSPWHERASTLWASAVTHSPSWSESGIHRPSSAPEALYDVAGPELVQAGEA